MLEEFKIIQAMADNLDRTIKQTESERRGTLILQALTPQNRKVKSPCTRESITKAPASFGLLSPR